MLGKTQGLQKCRAMSIELTELLEFFKRQSSSPFEQFCAYDTFQQLKSTIECLEEASHKEMLSQLHSSISGPKVRVCIRSPLSLSSSRVLLSVYNLHYHNKTSISLLSQTKLTVNQNFSQNSSFYQCILKRTSVRCSGL